MKKAGKIALWVIGSITSIVIVLFLSADIIASRFVQKKVQETFAQLPDAEAMVGGIYLNLLSGSAVVKDITFCTNSLTLEDSVTNRRAPGLAVHIPTLAVFNIHYPDLLRDHDLEIFSILIDDPQLVLYIDEKNPASILPAFPKDTTFEKAEFWLRKIALSRFKINDFRARIHSTSSPLNLSIDSLSTEWRDIAYDFKDSVFTFNDSVYELSLNALRAQLPDGVFELEVHDLQTSDQGPLEIGYTRLRNSVTPKQLADLRREPTSWIDMEVNHVKTSPFNPIRKIQAQDYTLTSIEADVRRMHVCRDTRHAPKHPFGTPQEFLMALPVRFAIQDVKATAHKMDLEVSSTEINCGKLHFHSIQAHLSNVTNRPGAIWRSVANAPVGEAGLFHAQYTMHMDKKASYDLALHGTDIEIHDLNTLLRPLIGMTCECHINQIDAEYYGDQHSAKGSFCMQYKGLNVNIHKEDHIPYEILAKNADFFSGVANSLIPKSNPTAVDISPRRYHVEWKRDEWKPYPLYLFGPCIDGVKMTMLPGLFVHKQIMN